MRRTLNLVALAIACAMPMRAEATELKVMSAGAFKAVLMALKPAYEKESGDKLDITYRTVGQNLAAIRDDKTAFDVVVLTPQAIESLIKEGKVAKGSADNLAKVCVGVVVKAGAPRPAIATVAEFKAALLKAKSVAYIDPKAGGSSGIYVAHLLERLGIAKEVNAKAVLVPGGAVADHIADGEAEIGVHQISEILPVKGVTLVGPLPAGIQNYTTYAAGVSATSKHAAAAHRLIEFLAGPHAVPVLKKLGMQQAS